MSISKNNWNFDSQKDLEFGIVNGSHVLQKPELLVWIRGFEDNVPGTTERTGEKGRMNFRVFSKFLCERQVSEPIPNGHTCRR